MVDSMMAPELLARALKNHGLGSSVVSYLERTKRVRRSSQSPGNRVSPTEHHETIAVNSTVASPTRILLVDDVVTMGSTFLGSAWSLLEAYPDVEIRAFAAMRTSSPNEFKNVLYPCTGTIKLNKHLEPRRGPCQKVVSHVQTSLFDG